MQTSLREVLDNAEKISVAAQHTLRGARQMSKASANRFKVWRPRVTLTRLFAPSLTWGGGISPQLLNPCS